MAQHVAAIYVFLLPLFFVSLATVFLFIDTSDKALRYFPDGELAVIIRRVLESLLRQFMKARIAEED